MNIIAAVDKNWGIGYNNRLLVRIPEDMKLFRALTMGKVTVMGRKTLESINGGALEGRTNIVLAHDKNYKAHGFIVAHSMDELHGMLAGYATKDIFVIGGGSVYRQLLAECDTAFITKIDFAYDADTYFPDLDKLAEWRVAAESEEQTYFDIIYYFMKYERLRRHV